MEYGEYWEDENGKDFNVFVIIEEHETELKDIEAFMKKLPKYGAPKWLWQDYGVTKTELLKYL